MEISEWIQKYCRLTDYLSVSQLYLRDNFLLQKRLAKSHIKKRIVGHWGTCPGLNYIYASLNVIQSQQKNNMLLLVGPGHGYPAVQANLFLEESLGEVDSNYKLGKKGLANLIKDFSWPNKFPSHSNPMTPGAILEGGELGYALSTAFGAVFDNKDLIAVTIIGDGESETGPTAAAWHSIKFINPTRDGIVLPIVHINGYKIANPTIFGTMSDDELYDYFKGLHYDPIIVEPKEKDDSLYVALNYAIRRIKKIKKFWKKGDKPLWPVILFKSAKGWGGIESFQNIRIERNSKSHGVPINPNISNEQLSALNKWLKFYKVNELVNKNGSLKKEILEYIPEKKYRLGMNKHANGGKISKKLILPDPKNYANKQNYNSSLVQAGHYLADVFKQNPKNFRLFCPDELESNFLDGVFRETKRVYCWPYEQAVNQNIAYSGRVMEILSEHTLQGWMSGYLLTGRHGMFSSYEAFIEIVSSMVDQFAKFLKQSEKVKWRKKIPSMNFILTSLGWRQDHNGFSHQNPSFISNLTQKHDDFMNVYFPTNSDMMLIYMKKCLESKSTINTIVAGKRSISQALTYKESLIQVEKGAMIWKKFSDKNPDLVYCASGDYCTQEMLAGLKLLKKECPEINIRFLSISDLNFLRKIQARKEKSHEWFDTCPIIYNFHGYPDLIQSMIYDCEISQRIIINGYIEEGTTTTPFDMQVKNKTDRFNLIISSLKLVENKISKAKINKLIKKYEKKIKDHSKFIEKNGYDMPEIKNWLEL